MSSLSIVINTKNAAETLKTALVSCDFAQEVIVADMASSDDTLAIAKQAGAQIVRLKEYGKVEPEGRNEAFGAASCEWIFQLDADEYIPPSLQEKIHALVDENDPDTVAYAFARRNQMFGHWMKHTGWWPDYQVRLFKNGSAKYAQGVHSKLVVSGTTVSVPAETSLAIHHVNYRTVEQYVERLNRYTTLAAAEKAQALSERDFLSVFSGEFFRRFFDQQGYKDGEIGTLLSLLQSFYEVSTQAKVALSNPDFEFSDTPVTQQAQLKALEQFHKDMAYWIAHTHEQTAASVVGAYWWKLRKKMRI